MTTPDIHSQFSGKALEGETGSASHTFTPSLSRAEFVHYRAMGMSLLQMWDMRQDAIRALNPQ